MAVTSQVSEDGKTLTISISGKFDFNSVQEFRNAYADKEKYKSYVLSMERVEHIDSSALGMLLNMKKFLGNDVPVTIKNCKPSIKKIFTISRFDKKFDFA